LIEVIVKKLFLIVVLIACAPLFYVMDGAIIKDLRLKSETLAPAYIMTTDRRCKSKAFLFHSCSYKYQTDHEGKKQSYFFLSFGAPETLMLIRGNSSGGITSDVGQDYLVNRIVTLLIFPLLALFVLLKGNRVENGRTQPDGAPRRNLAPEARPVAQPTARPTAPPSARSGKPVFGKRR
jgi:hypothetical protein